MVTSIAFDPPLRIIVVEDYTSLREQLVIHLQTDGHLVQGADSGIELDELLENSPVPDILILDLNLPLEDGNSISARMRKAFPHLGIIMHTVRVSTSEKVKGYSHGADMYVSKPASPPEISAAVLSLGRRIRPVTQLDWLLDLQKKLLISPSNQRISLLPAELLTLHHLALSTDRIMTSEQLLELLKSVHPDWGKVNLEVHFSRFRKKLSTFLKEEPVIKSVRGVGYQLCLRLTIRE
ncbi:MAG: response regulator transcription factor [Methylococcaceae bacterium]